MTRPVSARISDDGLARLGKNLVWVLRGRWELRDAATSNLLLAHTAEVSVSAPYADTELTVEVPSLDLLLK